MWLKASPFFVDCGRLRFYSAGDGEDGVVRVEWTVAGSSRFGSMRGGKSGGWCCLIGEEELG